MNIFNNQNAKNMLKYKGIWEKEGLRKSPHRKKKN